MTPAQAAWLRKLRDEGPQQTRFRFANFWHQVMGYSITAWFDMGVKRRHWWTHMITPAGLAALEAHEKTLPTDRG